MPSGYPKNKAATTETPTRGGLRGRIDKLFNEYTKKAAALQVALGILDEDDRATALAVAPKKFLQAINQRDEVQDDDPMFVVPAPKKKKKRSNGRLPAAERVAQITAYLTAHPRSTVNEISDGIKLNHSRVRVLLDDIATTVDLGGKSGWVLKGSAPKRDHHAKKTTGRKQVPRQSAAARLEQVRAFLAKHSESTMNEISDGINLKGPKVREMVLKVGKLVAGSSPKRYVLRVVKMKAAKASKAKKVVKKSQAERLAEIRAYLTDHPGATTRDLAQVLGVINASPVNPLARMVAQPREAVKSRQAIHWVLKEA